MLGDESRRWCVRHREGREGLGVTVLPFAPKRSQQSGEAATSAATRSKSGRNDDRCGTGSRWQRSVQSDRVWRVAGGGGGGGGGQVVPQAGTRASKRAMKATLATASLEKSDDPRVGLAPAFSSPRGAPPALCPLLISADDEVAPHAITRQGGRATDGSHGTRAGATRNEDGEGPKRAALGRWPGAGWEPPAAADPQPSWARISTN